MLTSDRRVLLFTAATGLLAVMAPGASGCGAPMHDPPTPPVEDVVVPSSDAADDAATGDAVGDRPDVGRCQDNDGDGYGMDCGAGADCNDDDPTITDQCYRCVSPNTGCPCDHEGDEVVCNVLTDSMMASPGGVCQMGTRICRDGLWGRCITADGIARTVRAPASCGVVCSPNCRSTAVCPTSSTEATGGVGSSGTQLADLALPSFCGSSGLRGGVTIGRTGWTGGTGTGTACATPLCGGACCTASQSCYSMTESRADALTSTTCAAGTSTTAATTFACGGTCAAGRVSCGTPPFDVCCAAGQACVQGTCQTPGRACTSNAGCTSSQVCSGGACYPLPAGSSACGCTSDASQNSCLAGLAAAHGEVVNDIFRTPDGRDARFLRFGQYLRGLESPASVTCRVGSSARSATCTTCSPASCAASRCDGTNPDAATIGAYANTLDWRWTQHTRYDSTGAAVTSANAATAGGFAPWRSRVYDLGAPANRVVLFPVTSGTGRCLESLGFTVWLSDNPDATSEAAAGTTDPSRWNRAVLSRVFVQGWTRNTSSTGSSSDTTDLTAMTGGVDAAADGMVSVWALPCGQSFRYAAVSAGNITASPTACQNAQLTDRLDAVAGLDTAGNSLAIYHSLARGTRAGPDPLAFSTTLRTADVYFLIDTTGSMAEERNNLITSLTSGTLLTGCDGGLIGAVRCIIPNAWMGVGHFEEFPIDPYGRPASGSFRGNIVYEHSVDISSDVTPVRNALTAYTNNSNITRPESDVPALYATASGLGISPFVPSRAASALGACPTGRIGYPCFRPGTIPIVMLITDAPFQNGPANQYPYDDCVLFGGCGTALTFNPLAFPAALPALDPVIATGNTNEDTSTALAGPAADNVKFSGSTSSMSNDATGSCGGSNGRDAAFVLDVPTTRTYRFDTRGASWDTVLYVTRASDGREMGCNDNISTTVKQSELSVSLAAGRYYVWVDGAASNQKGSYVLRWSADANDNTTGAYTVTVDTPILRRGFDITLRDDRLPSCGGVTAVGAVDAAYVVDVPSRQRVDFDTLGSGLDTILSVTRATDGSEVGCNDNWTTGSLESALSLTLDPGRYYVWVDRRGTALLADSYQLRWQVAMLNDAAASAYVLPAQTDTSLVQLRANTANALNDYQPSCGATLGRDLAYTFTVASRQRIAVDTRGSSFDTVLAITRAGGGEVACNNDISSTVTQSVLNVILDPGTYTLWVDGNSTTTSGTPAYNTASGDVILRWGGLTATLENQAGALALSETAAIQYSGSTTGMANDYEPTCARPSGRDAAFVFDLTARRRIFVDTRGSSFDTVLAITRASDGAEVACNDDLTDSDSDSELSVTLDPGRYYLWVDGDSGTVSGTPPINSASGSYVLHFGARTGVPAGRSPQYPDAVTALNSIGARVITINSDSPSDPTLAHAVPLANATGSIVGGAPAVYNIASDGTGLSTAVVTAVSDLANYSRMTVTAVAIDNPATAFDERRFVASPTGAAPGTVRLSDPTRMEPAPFDSSRCTGTLTTSGGVPIAAQSCLPGTNVNFRAEFVNDAVDSLPTAQTFTFDIVTYGDGTYELGRVPVTIVVPALSYRPQAVYTYDVTMTAADMIRLCGPGRTIQWTRLVYDASTPAGTSIVMAARTALTAAALPTAPLVQLGTAPMSASPIDLAAMLRAAGQPVDRPNLRLQFTLNADPTGATSPALAGFNTLFDCVDGT